MIPKKIHYCWFGRGEKPRLAQKCIASWKKYCPDYEIIEWNEDNFDVNQFPYTAWCMKYKKYAFLSDFVRLLVVKKHGGIYFDTDVELLKSPDALLSYPAFYGFESEQYVASGLGFGSEPEHPVITAMAERYLQLSPNQDGHFFPIGCPILNTEVLNQFGLVKNGKRQTVAGAEILPADFLNPFDDATGRLCTTENTVSVHWYMKSALSKKTVLRSKITRPLHRILGKDFFKAFRKG